MKLALFLLASLIATPLSHAGKDLRCTVSLMHPQWDDGSGGIWLPFAAGFFAFDHDPTKEEIVWLKLNLVVPPQGDDPSKSSSMWGLKRGTETDADYALDFSKKNYNGKTLPGREFSFYMRIVKEWTNPSWQHINRDMIAASLPVPVTEAMNGYLVVNCLKK